MFNNEGTSLLCVTSRRVPSPKPAVPRCSTGQRCGQSNRHVFDSVFVLPPALYYVCIPFVKYDVLCHFCCAHIYSAHLTFEASCGPSAASRPRPHFGARPEAPSTRPPPCSPWSRTSARRCTGRPGRARARPAADPRGENPHDREAWAKKLGTSLDLGENHP